MTKKKITTTVNDGWVEPKKRKPRKPMTPEQRAAAIERLALARAAKAPAKNSSIHKSLLNLPEDYYLHPNKIKEWIKTQKGLLAEEKSNVRRSVSGSIAKVANHEGYIRNLNSYLKNGYWIDMFYGEYQQGRIKWVTIVPKG
tara:strand:+ start:7370 stop:7795 length:426 start_codon:yes stop_codon:yes gene_type:complete